jgi:hypothetical protein
MAVKSLGIAPHIITTEERRSVTVYIVYDRIFEMYVCDYLVLLEVFSSLKAAEEYVAKEGCSNYEIKEHKVKD